MIAFSIELYINPNFFYRAKVYGSMDIVIKLSPGPTCKFVFVEI